MHISLGTHPAVFLLSILLCCITQNSFAESRLNRVYELSENRSHWVCDYYRGQDSVLVLRCDNIIGLVNDHDMLKQGYESETTQYIPIWNRPYSDDAAIDLVRILLCDQGSDCNVEMSRVVTSNY